MTTLKMTFNLKTVASAALMFAALGNSHLMLKTPVPYGLSTLDNSPLDNAWPGNYPCKQRPGVYDITAMNNMKVGDPQELSFTGDASHGGGTCQLAVTLDKEPTPASQFKLIQVFEGGCPIDSDGNGNTHPFTFTIPKDFPNGVATLAWMWYNRIGNREAYMNCAPITVTGGSDSKDYYNSLPNMYLINLPYEQCESDYQYESNAVTIPYPGQFILKETSGQDMHAATGPNCSAKAKAQLDGVVGYKSAVITDNGAAYKAPATNGDVTGPATAAPTAASGSASSAPAASSQAAGSSGAASSGATSGMVTISTGGSAPASSAAASMSSAAPSSAAAAPSSAAAAPSSAAAAPSSAAAAPSSAPAASGAMPSSSTGSSGSCSSTSGGITCSSGGEKFCQCANSQLICQPVAPGTKCVGGQIQKRSYYGNAHHNHARLFIA